MDSEPLKIKVFDSEIIIEKHELAVGSIRHDKKHLDIAVAEGFVRLLDIQQAGKKRMHTHDFLNGFTISDNAFVQ
jgi:methionyl-tRNA formyltransferase